jgi:hypothetical protein
VYRSLTVAARLVAARYDAGSVRGHTLAQVVEEVVEEHDGVGRRGAGWFAPGAGVTASIRPSGATSQAVLPNFSTRTCGLPGTQSVS